MSFKHGTCEITPGCKRQAIFRLNTGKSCKECKPESVIFAPFLGQQEKFFQRRERVVFYGGAVAGGKAGALSQMVPTPSGWVQNGDIVVGDKVIGVDGRPVTVVALSEVFYDEDMYRLSFSDGTSIEVGANHLWLTSTYDDREKQWRRSEEYRSARRAKRPSRAVKNTRPWISAMNASRVHDYKPMPSASVKTTKDIADTLFTRRGIVNHAIDQHAPLDLQEAVLPVPPYTLGAWLGDGTTLSGQVSGLDAEVFDGIRADGYVAVPYASGTSHHVRGLIGHLRSAGVLGNKHIPSVYLRASLAQRLALLRGIMDTDGWCEKDGSCKVAFTRKELFDGVVELIRTMGIVVRLTSGMKSATNGSAGNSTRCWQATFATGMKVFTLPRKLIRQREPQDRWKRRYITAAENLGPQPMRCIQIANDDGMYLAGEQFIPTHNSLCLMMKFAQIISIEKRRFNEARKAGKRHVSTAWGIYFRRTTPDLEQMKDLSEPFMKALDPHAKFNDNKGIWKFPSAGGAVFQFSHMEHERDKFKHKSRAYVYVAWDELTEFSETQYDYIDTRLRTTDKFLEPYLQMCSASNPDGEGLVWVRERFIEIAKPEEVVSIETKLKDGRLITYEQVYIPAKLDDNPIMMESGIYEASLMNKRPEVRKALLEGNWYVVAGAFFGNVWDSTIHVCEDHDVPEGARVFRSGDWGILAWTSIGWWYEDADGGLTMFAHLRCQGLTADLVADKVAEVEARYGYWDEETKTSRLNFARNPLDSQCFADAGTMGSPTVAKDFARKGVRWKKARKGPGSRFNGAAQMLRRFQTMIPAAFPGATGPTERERPMLRFMRNCTSPIKTIPALRADPNNMDDVDTKGDDHDHDMCLISFTNVVTPDGSVPIGSLVGSTGLALSFDGQWHAFKNCRQTRRDAEVICLRFEDGTSITCTPDHRILGADGMWREARDYDVDSYAWLTTRSEFREPSRSGMVSGGTCAASISSEPEPGFISPSIEIATGQSLRDLTSTIVTTTGATTASPTSNFLMRLPGTDPTKAAPGILGPPRPLGATESPVESSARSAAKDLRPEEPEGSSTAPTLAEPRDVETRESTTWSGPAPSAGYRTWQTGMRVDGFVPARALRVVAVETAGRADVYCLEVQGPAAFAVESGVIVSNCMYAVLENPVSLPTDDTDWDEDDEEVARPSRAGSSLTLGPPIK